MPNSLELSDEVSEPLALRAEIEAAFGVRLDGQSPSALRTMGDLHAAVLAHLSATRGDANPTELAFLRLQRALAPLAPDQTLRPDTPLSALPVRSPRALFRMLARKTGLRLPSPLMGPLAGLGWILALAFCVIVPALLLLQEPAVLIIGVGALIVATIWPLQRLDPLRYPPRCATLGDLARLAAAHNAATLAREGGRLDADSVWAALVELVSGHTLANTADIRRDTTILRPALA